MEGIKASSQLEKHFKWFYTDYTFTETFANEDSTLFPIPLSQFLSADTASFWFTGQPNLTRSLSGAEMKEIGKEKAYDELVFTPPKYHIRHRDVS